MAKSLLKLDTRGPLNDGTCPVKVSVGYGRDLYISTGVSVHPDNWDPEHQCCTGPKAKGKNETLTKIFTKVESRVMELRLDGRFNDLSNAQIRYYIENGIIPEPEKPKKPTLGVLYRQIMAVKSKRNAQLFNDTLKKLMSYTDIDKVLFEDINKLWLDGFCASLGNLAPNTKSIHLRNLRTVINYAIDCDVTANYPFRRFSIPTESTKKRNLSAAVLRNLATAELSPTLSKWRDLFMLSFYLIGINVVDLCGLRTIEDGRIDYVRAKTGKRYSIKVWPEAKAIIEKYAGKDHLLYMLDEYSDYRKFYQCYESGLRNIAKTLGIPALTSYYSRHSWATIASKLDIPKETIAAALGHELGNATTSIYIDYDITKVDAANRRIIGYVLYNKK